MPSRASAAPAAAVADETVVVAVAVVVVVVVAAAVAVAVCSSRPQRPSLRLQASRPAPRPWDSTSPLRDKAVVVVVVAV